MFFEKSTKLKPRLKLLVYGKYGTGKTMLALQFPNPVVIDTEGGTKIYGNDFNFDVAETNDIDEAIKMVQWLQSNKHKYKTLVIDSITPLWENVKKKYHDIFLKRKVGTVGYKHDYYDFQPKDWLIMTMHFNKLIMPLTTIDMNVVITAREATLYSTSGFMEEIGKKPDAQKNLPYIFDATVRLTIEKGRRIAYTEKCRGGYLPDKFFTDENNGDGFDFFKYYDMLREPSSISAETKPIVQDKSESKGGDKITKKQLNRLQDRIKNYSESQVRNALNKYGVSSLEELTQDKAEAILSKIK